MENGKDNNDFMHTFAIEPKMKKISILLLLILSLFLTSCSNNDNIGNSAQPSEESDLNDRILALETQIKTMEEGIEKINEDSTINLEEDISKTNEYINRTNMLLHLIENLPSVTVKEGYIVDYINEDNNQHFIIDYAEMLDDEESPNGFIIDNESVENDKVMITENLELFIGEYASDPSFPSQVDLDFEDLDMEEIKQGFYKFYFIENELTLVLRMYIP